jgi:hypothetical protein
MMKKDAEWGTFGGMLGRKKPKYSEITCSSSALFTTNPT